MLSQHLQVRSNPNAASSHRCQQSQTFSFFFLFLSFTTLCVGMLLRLVRCDFSSSKALPCCLDMGSNAGGVVLENPFSYGEGPHSRFEPTNCAHMCGITFSRCASELPSELFEALCTACHSRGPDYQGRRIVEHVPSNTFLHFYASVLHLRGDHVARQPFVDSQNVLIYVRALFTVTSHCSDQYSTERGGFRWNRSKSRDTRSQQRKAQVGEASLFCHGKRYT